MILCITEKPSVAKDIANILGASSRHDGFYEGNGYQVSWTYGHLCMLKEPADYTPMWKPWALSYLPMIPQRFGIKVIDQPSIKKQFHVLETLIGKCDKVINCGDAGQEGELIQRWVMQKADCHVPVLRLWISSLTDESIRKGFQDLKPQSDYDNLYYAGLSRAIGDWILGMNATRLYSLKYSSPGNLLSIGRVQTPTLALIVKRHFEIVNFKPEDYWELKTLYRDVTFNATHGKFTSIEKANAALEQIKGKPFTVTDVQEKKGKESPPRLFDLTSLQVECNKIFGWTADETLKLIQSCYEKKVTTYPRVDTTYLTDDIYDQVPGILQKMTPYAPLTAKILSKKLPKSKKVFDNSKVTDHHAIIPTGESPTVLVGNERQLYHLIAMRFIAAFYPDCVFSQTTVMGKVEETEFKAVGKVILDPGWRVLFDKPKPKPDPNKPQAQNQQQATQSSSDNNDPDSDSDKDDSEDRILPPMTVGESGPHLPSLLKKTTQPPKCYTEGTLLRAMETAGKTVDDDELRDAMKENGIGRPSTRSAIIETLFKRRYIERKRKQIIPTPAGIQLIGTIKEELLKSAKLTGLWENKLRKIEKGEYTASKFIDELKQMIHKITFDVMTDNDFQKIEIDNKEHNHHHHSSSNSKGSTSNGTGTNSNGSNASGSSGSSSNSGSSSGKAPRKRTSSKSQTSTNGTGSDNGTAQPKTRRKSTSKKSAANNNQTSNTQPGNIGTQPGTTPTPGTPMPNNPNGYPSGPVGPNTQGYPSGYPGNGYPNYPTGNQGNTGTQGAPGANPANYPYNQNNQNNLNNPSNPNNPNGNLGNQGSVPPNYPQYPGNPAHPGKNTASQGVNPQGYSNNPNGYNGYPAGYGSYPAGYPNNPNYNPNSLNYPTGNVGAQGANQSGYPNNTYPQNSQNGNIGRQGTYPQGYPNTPNGYNGQAGYPGTYPQNYPNNPYSQNNPYNQHNPYNQTGNIASGAPAANPTGYPNHTSQPTPQNGNIANPAGNYPSTPMGNVPAQSTGSVPTQPNGNLPTQPSGNPAPASASASAPAPANNPQNYPTNNPTPNNSDMGNTSTPSQNNPSDHSKGNNPNGTTAPNVPNADHSGKDHSSKKDDLSNHPTLF